MNSTRQLSKASPAASQATSQINPAPAGQPVVWPAFKIPWVTAAFGTCGISVDCDEAGVDVERLEACTITITHAAHAAPISVLTPARVRADVRTYKASAIKVAIKSLDYPSALDMF